MSAVILPASCVRARVARTQVPRHGRAQPLRARARLVGELAVGLKSRTTACCLAIRLPCCVGCGLVLCVVLILHSGGGLHVQANCELGRLS